MPIKGIDKDEYDNVWTFLHYWRRICMPLGVWSKCWEGFRQMRVSKVDSKRIPREIFKTIHIRAITIWLHLCNNKDHRKWSDSESRRFSLIFMHYLFLYSGLKEALYCPSTRKNWYENKWSMKNIKKH